MNTKQQIADDCPIIALDHFIQATRDSGYKGTASAISELVDNSLQAGADRISVHLAEVDGEFPVEVFVVDNGRGMDPFTLRQALRFGGSSRFGDRSGLGRYGMGLPNSSLSQGCRVTVYTWQSPVPGRSKAKRQSAAENVYTSYLDVDEIARGELKNVPVPRVSTSVPACCTGPSGTVVHWQRCDRLDNRRISTLARKLSADLGRRFRHYVWQGTQITVNGESVEGIDPLFLRGPRSGAELFGEEMTYEIAVDPNDPSKGAGVVRVRFSELPVHEWHTLSNDEKRERGISKGAGVSIVRAGREVDYGWFFMGDKRRENYDDWWRCEVRFEPILDEVFGITHTKQQVRPRAHLLDALTNDLETTARAINAKVRKAHLETKAQERFAEVERLAGERDKRLLPLPRKGDAEGKRIVGELKKKNPALRETAKERGGGVGYSIVEKAIDDMSFYKPVYDGDRVVLIMNPQHPFYKEVYGPLVESETGHDKELRGKLELFLLAAARTEIAAKGSSRESLAKFRRDWSNALATFLNR